MARYFDALKKMFPVSDMAGVLDSDLGLEAKYLDEADGTAVAQLDQLFPDTSDGSSLQAWLDFTDTTEQSDCLGVFENFKVRDGMMNPDYYISLCSRYGLDATVYEGIDDMFRVGSTELPHALYAETWRWTWSIDTTGTIDATAKSYLKTEIADRAPAWTQVSFTGSLA